MGLSGKIVSLVLVSVSLTAVISVALIQYRLQQGFNAIERQQAREQMQQLAHNLNGEFDRLNQIESDWANWDEMYDYMQHPTTEFTEKQISPAALQTVGLKYTGILDIHNNIIFSEAVNLVTGKGESATPFDGVIANVKRRLHQPYSETERNCGLDVSVIGPVMVY